VWNRSTRARPGRSCRTKTSGRWYFSQIRVDPNTRHVYVGGVNPQKSVDSGKTFQPIRGMGHVDNHAIWIDPLSGTPGNDSKHIFYGNDGGQDVSYDAGATWESVRMQAAALSYHVSVDMRRPYWVCTGLQDNGSWCGPSSARTGGIHQWNWISVGGGDGFQSQIDPTDPNIFYTESQNAGLSRYNLNTGQITGIKPHCQAREDPAAAVEAADVAAASGGGRCGGGGAARSGRGGRSGAAARAAQARPVRGGGRRRSAQQRDQHAAAGTILSSTGTRRSGCRRTTEHRAHRRTPALHLARSRRDVDDLASRRQEHRPADQRIDSSNSPDALCPAAAGGGGGGAGRARARQAVHPVARTTATSPTSSAR
jgi:hypothetical protein